MAWECLLNSEVLPERHMLFSLPVALNVNVIQLSSHFTILAVPSRQSPCKPLFLCISMPRYEICLSIGDPPYPTHRVSHSEDQSLSRMPWHSFAESRNMGLEL